MKTINQGSIDFLKSGKGRDTCGGYLPNRWFEAGVEFAQKWNLIERDQYALIDSIQKEHLLVFYICRVIRVSPICLLSVYTQINLEDI